MKGITYCGACADYDIKKHRCKRGAKLESNPQDKFFDDCPLPDAVPVVRCKDCLFWKSGENECESWEWCMMLNRDMPPHAFCNLGERKNEERNER